MENPPSQLNANNHPFLQNVSQLMPEIKSFFEKVLATERDILAKCNVAWPHYKFFVLTTLHNIAAHLERCTMDNVMSPGVRVDLLARFFEGSWQSRLSASASEDEYVQDANEGEAKAYLHQSKNLLKHAEERLGKKQLSPTLMKNYKIKIFWGL